jgi:hypothetical protein
VLFSYFADVYYAIANASVLQVQTLLRARGEGGGDRCHGVCALLPHLPLTTTPSLDGVGIQFVTFFALFAEPGWLFCIDAIQRIGL